MKHLATFILVLVCATAHAEYQRLATETYPGGGSGPTNGVTTAQVTNIWNELATDKMVPQFDENRGMTSSESLFVENIVQFGDDQTNPLYGYLGGMANGLSVNGSANIDGTPYNGTVIAGPGVVQVRSSASDIAILTPSNLTFNGIEVGGPTSYITNHENTAFIAADGTARRIKSLTRQWTPSESPRYDPPGFNDIYYNDVKWQKFAGMFQWTAKKWMYNGVEWIDKGYFPMLSDHVHDPNATSLMFPDVFSTVTEYKETSVLENTRVAYTNDIPAVYLRSANVSGSTLYITNSAGVEVSFAGGSGGAYLPLAGGTMTGTIKFSGVPGSARQILSASNDQYLEICATKDGVTSHNGSFLALTGNDNPSETASNKGRFRLGVGAADGTRNIALMGYRDGRLKWNSTNIVMSVNGIAAADGGNVTLAIPSTNGFVTASVTNGLASRADIPTNYLVSAHVEGGTTLVITNSSGTAISFTGGGGGGVTEEAVTNIATYVATNLIASYVNTDVCWSKPNLWCLEFQLGYTATVVGHVSTVTNDYGAIYETKSVTYAYGNYADLYPEVYDEYHLDPVIVTNYTCTTTGGTISPAGRLTTTGDGVYHCIATDANGVSSAVDVPIQNTLQEIVDTPIYAADVNPSDRKTSNDDAKTLMTSPTSAGTGTYEGITYNIWNFFTQPVWAATQAGSVGNTKAFALGTTVMASAAHYAWHSGGTQVVGGTTVTKGAAERLYDWALAHGWTKAQLDDMNIRDIEVIPLTAGTIPTSDLPYLMTEAQLDASYGSLAGVQCWTAVQAFAQPITRVYTSAYGTSWSNYYESRSQTAVKPWRDDLTTLITALGTTYPVHSGDSGHPIYFKDASGRYVLTSHYNYVGGGPNYIKGFPVIKAYVEAHGGTVREIP